MCYAVRRETPTSLNGVDGNYNVPHLLHKSAIMYYNIIIIMTLSFVSLLYLSYLEKIIQKAPQT